MSPSLRLFAVWSLVIFELVMNCPAATLPAKGYAMRIWQTEDGLPQNMVTSAVQTQDGYLWFGTYSGLARFDGARFTIFDTANTPQLKDKCISCLFEDAQGTLWIGHETGAITRFREGRFEPVIPPSGIIGEKVIGLGSDEQGRLWAMRENGAVDSLDHGQRLPSLIGPAAPGIMAWARSAHGRIWLTENGQAARLANGVLEAIAFDSASRASSVMGLAATADGGAWVLGDGRIRKWENDRWTEDRGLFPWGTETFSCGLELHDGTLAVGTVYAGLYLIFRDGRRPVHLDRNTGLPQDWVRFLYEDREGNLWLGTGSAGLVALHTTAFSVLNAPDQWQGCTVLSVAPGREGALWIGTDGAGLYRYQSGEWKHYGEAEGLSNRHIPAVAESPDGEVWAANYWRGSPYRLAGGRFLRPECVDAQSSPVFALLTPGQAGEVLVGNRDGLLQLHGDQATWLIQSPGDLAGVRAIVRDRHGVIWCGYAQGGLARLADGKLTTFRRKDGLASDEVQSLLSDEDGSLWIGTADAGLCRFKDGRFANLNRENGLADNFIGYLLDDGLGYLWLSTHHGLQRLAKDELNRCADGLVPAVTRQIYDHSDGLPTIELTGGLQSVGCKAIDGSLWFASSKGLVGVDPARIEANPTPPPVVLEALLVDGRSEPFANGAVLGRLPPDHRRIEFQFSGLSFVSPTKVLFKYRLDGIDQTWIDAGTKRTAYYSRLPAGAYRFHVIACNNDGVWNTTGATLRFTVTPFFWQTWWFIGATTLLALTGVALFARHLTRRRLQRRMEQLERQNAIERERARIAQDIHDDIGTSLTRIAMFSQPDPAEMVVPQQAAAVLARIFSATQEMTRSLDETVWAVDPRHDTLDSLVSYMGRCAQDLLGAANVRCRLDLPSELPAWRITAETRHHLFLAFKETLNNTVKHAQATEVRISLRLQPAAFVLVIKDNGRGFDRQQPGAPASGRLASGNGLPNLERRLARIHGRCEIVSQPGAGTEVSFIVEVPA